MSSGFVPAGSQSQTPTSSDDWDRAKRQVEAVKTAKPSTQGQQEGGKSLYEHLQANKAAKQEAFEEAAKLRNQFRALDDSEVDFLESIKEKERASEAAVRHEDAEQLAIFRKERAAAERSNATTTTTGEPEDAVAGSDFKLSWATAKKKRRAPEAERDSNNKSRRLSTEKDSHPETEIYSARETTPDTRDSKTDQTTEKKEPDSKTQNDQEAPAINVAVSTGMGLDAYGSEDED